jgi:hypothetical protein
MHVGRRGSKASSKASSLPEIELGWEFDGAEPESDIRMGLLGQADSPMMK